MKNIVSLFSILYWAVKGVIALSLFQWWLGDAHAQVRTVSRDEFAEALAAQDHNKLLNLLGNGAFNFKETKACLTTNFGADRKHPGRGKVQYRTCLDGTLSFEQPNSTGIKDWNGFCGQTAAANCAAMICQRFAHPKVFDSYVDDLTPGSRPGTLRSGLSKFFVEGDCPSGKWQSRSPWTANGLLEELQSALWMTRGTSVRRRENGTFVHFTPVPVLISSGLQSMHWVTVVDFLQDRQDIYGCQLVMNTWGSQRVMTCKNFIDYAMNPVFGYRYLRFEPEIRILGRGP